MIEKKWQTNPPELDLAINTGIRNGSQYGLTWDMVDWKSRELHIPRTKNEEPLHVPLNDAAIAVLRVVFQGGDGRGEFSSRSKRASRSKTGGTDLTTQSWKRRPRIFIGTLEGTAGLLGHKSLTMTRRYAHLGPNKLHGVVSLLGASATTGATSENDATVGTAQFSVQ